MRRTTIFTSVFGLLAFAFAAYGVMDHYDSTPPAAQSRSNKACALDKDCYLDKAYHLDKEYHLDKDNHLDKENHLDTENYLDKDWGLGVGAI